MLHRAWLLLVVLSVFVQDSDAECAEKNRRNLSRLVGVGYDLLTDSVKEAVYEETAFYKRDDICAAVPEVADVIATTNWHHFNITTYCHDDYSLQQFAELTMLGSKPQPFVYENFVPIGMFSPAYERGRQLLQKADRCIVIGQKQANDVELKVREGSPISSRFKKRVLRIAKALTEGSTELAKYRAETLVRDYGTHVITRAIGYAQRIMIGTIPKRVMRKHGLHEHDDLYTNMNTRWQSSALFATAYKNEWLKEYGVAEAEIEKGKISTGTDDYTIEQYASLPRELSRMSDFVLYIDPAMNKNVSKLVEEVISKYYRANTYPGCMQVNASNFNSRANVDGDSCVEFTSFGGFFDNTTNKNPVTRKKGCDATYDAILVNEALKEDPPLYWCHSNDQIFKRGLSRSAYFGGIYLSNSKYNALTEANGCPDGYKSKELWSSSQDVIICYDDGKKARPAYELSRMKVVCGKDKSFSCPRHYERIDFDYKDYGSSGKCVIATCVFRGPLVDMFREYRRQFSPLNALPFTNVTDTEMDNESEQKEQNEQNEEDLPIAVIAGAVVALLLCIIIVVVTVCCMVRCMKAPSSSPDGLHSKENKLSICTGSSSLSKTPRTVPSKP